MTINDIKLEEYYFTKDFQTCSLLYATGQILDGQEWQNGVCYFRFQNKDACEKVIADFYNNRIILNAKVFYDSINTIKGILRTG